MFVLEFDETKSQSHLSKRGIDFFDAQRLWSDSRLLEIPARTEDEPRFLIIRLINEKYWSAVITHKAPTHSTPPSRPQDFPDEQGGRHVERDRYPRACHHGGSFGLRYRRLPAKTQKSSALPKTCYF